MKRIASVLTVALCATTVAVAAGAQAGQSMNETAMDGMTPTTYTGCVEAVNHGRSFVLTHVSDNNMDDMHGDTAMTHDAAMPPKAAADSMDHEAMHMMATAVVLSGRSDLRKHVGERVIVTGTVSKGAPSSGHDDLNTLAVKSLKVVAKACSPDGQ
jgi:hypothetical protein